MTTNHEPYGNLAKIKIINQKVKNHVDAKKVIKTVK